LKRPSWIAFIDAMAKIDGVKLRNIDAQLHCGRAIEDGQAGFAKPALPINAQLAGYLCGVFPSFEPLGVRGDRPVKIDKEPVCPASRGRFTGYADGVMKSLAAVASQPAHCTRLQLIPRNIVIVSGFRNDGHETRYAQCVQKLPANGFCIF